MKKVSTKQEPKPTALKRFDEKPDTICLGLLECVIMPNGEIISQGKTLGWFDKLHEFLYKKEV